MNDKKQIKREYMLDYANRELRILLFSSIIMTVYTSLVYLFFGHIMFGKEIERGMEEYLILVHIGWSILVITIIGMFIKKFCKNKQFFANYFHFASLFTYAAYLGWGIYVSYKTLEVNRFSITIWLIILSLLVIFLDILIPWFLVIMAVNLGAISVIIYNNQELVRDMGTEFINQMVFTLLLILAYFAKNRITMRSFKNKLAAEQAVKTRQLFSASMNHELRSPLNGILGNLQVLEGHPELSAESKEILDNIQQSAENMTQLVNDLLDFSRLEAGEFKIVKKDFDLRQMRDKLYLMFRQLAEEKGLSFTVAMETGTPSIVNGDEIRIEQIIINLISNGIKYTSEGGVAVEFSMQGNNLQVYVKDTGQGMAKETREALFSPFKRINEEGNTTIQGTGLGMFIVSKLLEQMGGSIAVDSALGHGTAYTIQIPVEIKGYNIDTRPSQNMGAEVDELSLKGVRILAVDDSDMNLVVLKGLLKQEEVDFTQCLSGKEALELLEKESYDLILLDHMMPEMDGMDCLKAIRKSEKSYANTPVIMLTGTGGVEETFVNAGANGYLIKPVDKVALFTAIKKAVRPYL